MHKARKKKVQAGFKIQARANADAQYILTYKGSGQEKQVLGM